MWLYLMKLIISYGYCIANASLWWGILFDSCYNNYLDPFGGDSATIASPASSNLSWLNLLKRIQLIKTSVTYLLSVYNKDPPHPHGMAFVV